jgi:hypothetical protein
MKRQHFCTLFDRNYLFKGVAMLESLAQHCPSAHAFVLCMDDLTYELLGKLAYPHVERVRLADVEDEALLAVKPGRGVAEYCWTLASCLSWHIFQTWPEVQQLTYLDADLLFFSPVQPLFEEIGDASIAIIEHRFIPRLQGYAINGRFNVEWVSFRRDRQGMACLERWREQCIEWCFNRLEEGRMGDQKYLDEWPDRYSSLCIIQHPGAGVAPWNYANYDIASGSGGITVDGLPLIFYHFHQLQMHSFGRFDYMANLYLVEKPRPVELYNVYERALKAAIEKVRKHQADFKYGIQPLAPWLIRRFIQKHFPSSLKSALKRFVHT